MRLPIGNWAGIWVYETGLARGPFSCGPPLGLVLVRAWTPQSEKPTDQMHEREETALFFWLDRRLGAYPGVCKLRRRREDWEIWAPSSVAERAQGRCTPAGTGVPICSPCALDF